MSEERRRYPRKPDERYAALRVVADAQVVDDQGFYLVIDLSRGGCRLRGATGLEPGAGVEVDVGFGEQILTFPGTVRNAAPGPKGSLEVGIQFDSLSDDKVEFIEKLLAD